MNKSRVWNIISGVIAYFAGVIYCATLIGIPVGIMFFIAAKRFMGWSQLADISIVGFKPLIRKWAIFMSIFIFPLGLVSIVPLIVTRTNSVVSDAKEASESVFTFKPHTETEQVTVQREESKNSLSDEETINKLKHLLEEGLITQEEYNRAVEEMNKKA